MAYGRERKNIGPIKVDFEGRLFVIREATMYRLGSDKVHIEAIALSEEYEESLFAAAEAAEEKSKAFHSAISTVSSPRRR